MGDISYIAESVSLRKQKWLNGDRMNSSYQSFTLAQ